jgi:hypothetical protein
MTVTNRLGKPITIKGKQVYVRLNGNLDNIGVAENPSAPTLEGQIGVEFTAPIIDVSDAKIQLGLTNADAGAGIVIFASLPVPNGHSKARMAQIYKASDSTTVSVTHTWDGYVAKWSYTPVAGDNIMLSAKYINATTGEESPLAVIGIVTVVA